VWYDPRMVATKTVHMLHGRCGMALRVPDSAVVLTGQDAPPLPQPDRAVRDALARPIGSAPLAELLADRRPQRVAITVSDITRPVPNGDFLPAVLDVLNAAGVADEQVVIIIGTGMHRPSTPQERQTILGAEIAARVRTVDHRADRPETLARVADDPPVHVCRAFVEADFRIVTGLIEPHFMAGFSGGRKGVCPALVDLATIQRFHGYDALADPRADNGNLDDNPCHEIALQLARIVGVDFLLNVAITRDRRIAGIYCGDLEQAHQAGCRQVADWAAAEVDAPYDLVVTNGGGWPLDETFYQTVKGMCTALPALGPESTLLVVSDCGEGLGSEAYRDLLLRWGHDWCGFLAEIASHPARTDLDQWELQMQARVLERIGRERLWLATDGIPASVQEQIAVHPVPGPGDARARAQRAIDELLARRPDARVAVVPDGPYTMLRRR